MELVNACGVLTTEQIQAMLFSNLAPASAERVCRRRLAALSDDSHEKDTPSRPPRIRRAQIGHHSSYVYFPATSRRPMKQAEHRLALNWVRAWFGSRLGPRDTLRWDYEQDFRILRCDAFVGVQDRTLAASIYEEKRKQAWRFWFVEMDRSHDAWDKTRKYNEVYDKDLYLNWWWAQERLTRYFPTILCVTVDEARKRMIEQSVRQENRNGLEFVVMTLNDIKREALEGGR